MAEHFGFFDAVQNANGGYDREYNAEQFTIPFDALVTNGVVRSAYEQLEVVTSGSNMISRVKSGIAFIEGHHYFNDGSVDLTHDVESLGMNRIDRVVIRKDSNPESRYVKAFIRKGIPSANPVPPTLMKNENIHEISLAQVRVVGGQGFISSIIDERGTSNGPWAGSDILPSYDDNLLADHVNNKNIHITPTERATWNNSLIYRGNVTTPDWTNLTQGIYTVYGTNVDPWIMQNANSFGTLIVVGNPSSAYSQTYYPHQGTSTTFTRNGGWNSPFYPWKRLLNQDDYNTLFQFVSNGKAAVANAITQKGVPTSPTAEFATMAANILNLTGFATGSRTVAANGVLSVDGLTFAPKVVFATIGEGETAGHVYVEKLSTAKGYVVGIFDGASQMQPGQPPIQISPVYIRHKADAVFTNSSFAIPITYNGVYTWYAYG